MCGSKDKKELIHCNKCSQKTKHSGIATRTQEVSEPYDGQYELTLTTVYDMLECDGCEEVSLRRRLYFSEWNPGEVEESFYPPRIARRLPPWKGKLPKEVVQMLEEVYAALQADSRSLAMMGARALIDMVMLREVGDVGSFPAKLAALQKAGFLSDKNRGVLEAALEVGNAVSHRGHRPSPTIVSHVMDIVENLLQTTVLQGVVNDLKKATPQRPSNKKKGNQ